MNKEELEKMFDDKFDVEKDGIYDYFFGAINNEPSPTDIKQFIFKTVIPEVLKSVLGKDVTIEINGIDILDYEKIKQKTKDNFGIDL